MEYKITTKAPFKLIGFQREFSYDSAYAEIPRFWDEVMEKYAANVLAGKAPTDPCEKALVDNCIGEYGVCIDDMVDGKFRYLIAGKYRGGELPAGMVLHEFPRCDWAVFDCFGPMPDALQSLNTRVFRDWLPNNPDYESAMAASIEWYDSANEMGDTNFHSAIWIPVKKKESK